MLKSQEFGINKKSLNARLHFMSCYDDSFSLATSVSVMKFWLVYTHISEAINMAFLATSSADKSGISSKARAAAAIDSNTTGNSVFLF